MTTATCHPPLHFWTEADLWRAYAQVEADKVRGVNEQWVQITPQDFGVDGVFVNRGGR